MTPILCSTRARVVDSIRLRALGLIDPYPVEIAPVGQVARPRYIFPGSRGLPLARRAAPDSGLVTSNRSGRQTELRTLAGVAATEWTTVKSLEATGLTLASYMNGRSTILLAYQHQMDKPLRLTVLTASSSF